MSAVHRAVHQHATGPLGASQQVITAVFIMQERGEACLRAGSEMKGWSFIEGRLVRVEAT